MGKGPLFEVNSTLTLKHSDMHGIDVAEHFVKHILMKRLYNLRSQTLSVTGSLQRFVKYGPEYGLDMGY